MPMIVGQTGSKSSSPGLKCSIAATTYEDLIGMARALAKPSRSTILCHIRFWAIRKGETYVGDTKT